MDFNLSFTANADPNELYDLIIIGGGPAGLTAGLYAARYKLKTLMIEKMPVSGGQLTSTEWVENYPGFPEPVLGQKLASDMEKQAKQFGLQIINETVTEVRLEGKIKQVHTPYSIWKAKAILISTGSSPRKLNVPGEAEFKGNGVSYCATCDGPFYPDKTIAVVGGGNTAFEESTFLAKYAAKIYLIHRSDEYRADKVLQERIRANPKVELLPFYKVEKIDFAHPEGRRLVLKHTGTADAVIPAQAGTHAVLKDNLSNPARHPNREGLRPSTPANKDNILRQAQDDFRQAQDDGSGELDSRLRGNDDVEVMVSSSNQTGKTILRQAQDDFRQAQDDGSLVLPVDGIFIFIGNDPNTKLFEGQLDMENGYIVTDRSHHTSVEGVWAAGDVQSKALRQVATAVGDGACAAHWINKYIEDWSE
jgi:thioredoxin reductase